MRRIWAVAIKEIRQVRRDPLTLVMLLGVPAMMLLLYGYALNFDVRHVALRVEDRSQSRASRELAAAFVESGYFDFAGVVDANRSAEETFERRSARAILVIPEAFASDLAAGRTCAVQLLLDGADANTATTVLGYADAIAAGFNVGLAATALAGSGDLSPAPIDYQPRVWFNPELKSTKFLVPGLIGFILMLTGVLSTALSVVREKERGTMEQLRVTALTPLQFVVGKVIPYLLISLAAAVVIIVAARVMFRVAVQGSYWDLFVVTLIYLVGALSFGLLVSSLAPSQAMAFQAGAVLSLLPAILLSGFIFPIRSMPVWLQAITYAVPARYYLIVARGVIVKGAGLAPYGRDMMFLVIYAAATTTLAFARLGRREA